jgi:hypothetical protein
MSKVNERQMAQKSSLQDMALLPRRPFDAKTSCETKRAPSVFLNSVATPNVAFLGGGFLLLQKMHFKVL